MIHSPALSNSEAFAGVGLLNHPHRISDFSSDGGAVDSEYALTMVIASNKTAIKIRGFGGLGIMT